MINARNFKKNVLVVFNFFEFVWDLEMTRIILMIKSSHPSWTSIWPT